MCSAGELAYVTDGGEGIRVLGSIDSRALAETCYRTAGNFRGDRSFRGSVGIRDARAWACCRGLISRKKRFDGSGAAFAPFYNQDVRKVSRRIVKPRNAWPGRNEEKRRGLVKGNMAG